MVQFSNSPTSAKKTFTFKIKINNILLLFGSPMLLLMCIAYSMVNILPGDGISTNRALRNKQSSQLLVDQSNPLDKMKRDLLEDDGSVDQELGKQELNRNSLEESSKPLSREEINTELLWPARRDLRAGGDAFWDLYIAEGAVLQQENPEQKIHVMEVGMHSANQCLNAAKNGLQVYCVEPSPKNTERIMSNTTGLGQVRRIHKKHIQFFQMAAGSETGIDLPFHSTGSTGDHVGGAVDIWNMKKIPEDNESKSNVTTVNVKSVAIDDIIENKVEPTKDYTKNRKDNKIDKLFLLKVDVQGFEPVVFSGLARSIEQHKIDYLVFEYWPKGIDFMNDAEELCVKPVEILKTLINNGYELYASQIVGHPRAPKAAKKIIHETNHDTINKRIFSDVIEHCKFFYKIEEMGPSDDYKLGYWTDFLAVSPEARFPKNPKREFLRTLVK